MLTSIREMHVWQTFDETLGLRELRHKVNGKAGMKGKMLANGLCKMENFFSINAEFCYGSRSVEIVRKYLDSDILEEYLYEEFWNNDRCWGGENYYRFNILAACVMTLGCTLSSKLRESLEKQQHPAYQQLIKDRQAEWQLKPQARVQMKKAVYVLSSVRLLSNIR